MQVTEVSFIFSNWFMSFSFKKRKRKKLYSSGKKRLYFYISYSLKRKQNKTFKNIVKDITQFQPP